MAKSYRPKIRRCYSVLEAETAAAEEAVIALGRQIASLIKEEGARP